MLQAQQQALFSQLNLLDEESRGFIEACNQLEAQVTIIARDTRPGFEGNTLLHEACRLGCPEAVVHLIELGHIVDCIDTCATKVTPLLAAIEAGNIDIVEILMRSGASLYAQDIRGDNAMHYGARSGSRMCIRLLKHPEMTAVDYRSLLATENVKLMIPAEYAANPYIEQLFTSMSNTNMVRNGPRKVKQSKNQEVNRTLIEKPGKISIVRVKLTDILNTELIGKPDLYAILTVGGKTEKLTTKNNCKTTEEWNDFFPISVDVITDAALPLEVTVYDQNKIRSDVKIGSCSISLLITNDIDWHGGKEITFSADLPNKGAKACGKVEVTAIVEPVS